MAKRELSSTLKNLKFMQRAALREEKSKKEEDEVKSDVHIFGTPTISRKCIFIMEIGPHPRAIKGQMSFQSFNPRIAGRNEEDAGLHQPAAQTSSSRNQSGNISIRENGLPVDGSNRANTSNEISGDLKRKQSDAMSEAQNPTKSPKNDNGDDQLLPRNSLGSFKKPKGD
ncbi:uncharacterized protein LOC114721204 [Neltuma alba]|uniref:uncharacterized protein LOC114721204 n=1 Tax=Neltuma alba TaxID=207710 RepID=UPI0010A329DA|nr:uncharacterized protein LOC114721204 [Prosopis alba]